MLTLEQIMEMTKTPDQKEVIFLWRRCRQVSTYRLPEQRLLPDFSNLRDFAVPCGFYNRFREDLHTYMAV